MAKVTEEKVTRTFSIAKRLSDALDERAVTDQRNLSIVLELALAQYLEVK